MHNASRSHEWIVPFGSFLLLQHQFVASAQEPACGEGHGRVCWHVLVGAQELRDARAQADPSGTAQHGTARTHPNIDPAPHKRGHRRRELLLIFVFNVSQ